MLTRRALFHRLVTVAGAGIGVPIAGRILEARPEAPDLQPREMLAVFSCDPPMSGDQWQRFATGWRDITKGTAFERVPGILFPSGLHLDLVDLEAASKQIRERGHL